jgi:hypothetical protein
VWRARVDSALAEMAQRILETPSMLSANDRPAVLSVVDLIDVDQIETAYRRSRQSDMAARRNRCMDCRSTESGGHDYMLRDEIWLSIVPDRLGLLCLSCVEKRLGRRLSEDDFLFTPPEMMARMFAPKIHSRGWGMGRCSRETHESWAVS